MSENMTPTHCPNCGAAITEENNGKFCLYCGGKLPEAVQNITKNYYNNTVENHYHTTVIQQTIQDAPIWREGPLTPEERVKEKPKEKIIAAVIGILLIIFALSSKVSFAAYLAAVFITFAIVKARKTNYCPHCYFHKELKDTKCPHCGKTIDSLLARILGAACIDTILIFTTNAIAVSPR